MQALMWLFPHIFGPCSPSQLDALQCNHPDTGAAWKNSSVMNQWDLAQLKQEPPAAKMKQMQLMPQLTRAKKGDYVSAFAFAFIPPVPQNGLSFALSKSVWETMWSIC